MRLTLTTLMITLPGIAMADPCLDEVHALFDGPLDPFQRPAHSQTTMIFDESGTQTREMLSLIETPMRTIAGEPSANWFTMAIDHQVWNGPSPEGPWTKTGLEMPPDREDTMRRAHQENKENLSDVTCHGADGSGRIVYSYRTQTTPDATGSFFGSLTTVTYDPGIGQVIEFDQTEMINAWTEGVSGERWVSTVTFDPTIKVTAPE